MGRAHRVLGLGAVCPEYYSVPIQRYIVVEAPIQNGTRSVAVLGCSNHLKSTTTQPGVSLGGLSPAWQATG